MYKRQTLTHHHVREYGAVGFSCVGAGLGRDDENGLFDEIRMTRVRGFCRILVTGFSSSRRQPELSLATATRGSDIGACSAGGTVPPPRGGAHGRASNAQGSGSVYKCAKNGLKTRPVVAICVL